MPVSEKILQIFYHKYFLNYAVSNWYNFLLINIFSLPILIKCKMPTSCNFLRYLEAAFLSTPSPFTRNSILWNYWCYLFSIQHSIYCYFHIFLVISRFLKLKKNAFHDMLYSNHLTRGVRWYGSVHQGGATGIGRENFILKISPSANGLSFMKHVSTLSSSTLPFIVFPKGALWRGGLRGPHRILSLALKSPDSLPMFINSLTVTIS